MPSLDETIETLRAALKLSPDNLPLRMLLGENLLSSGRLEEAEREFTVALALAPNDLKLAVSLAQACFGNGKYSQALVIIEDVIRKSEVPPRAYLLYARLLLNEGKLVPAQENYNLAKSLDAALRDPSLEERLGLKGNTGQSFPQENREKRPLGATASGEMREFNSGAGAEEDDAPQSEFDDLVETADTDFATSAVWKA